MSVADETQSVSNSPPTPAKPLVAAFEQAWERGERPDIGVYLAGAGGGRGAVLVELVRADLERRLQAGEPARVESYLERYPELAQDPEALGELIVSEYSGRKRSEPQLTLAHYQQRFPQFGGRLAQRLQTLPGQGGTLSLVHPLPTPQHRVTEGDTRLTQTPAPALARPDWPTVAGYEIVGELGRGGMGVVFKAHQLRPERTVALKMIRSGELAGAEELARFRAEAEAVAHLQHPHIVQIHEVGEAKGSPFFSLEYVDGGSLAHQVKSTPLPARQAAQLVQLLARAMHFAHQRGIIHRDLKPHNILLALSDRPEAIPLGSPVEKAPRYEPKIGDFGLAKRLDSIQGQTQTGAIMGTPNYMAPEQAAGKTRQIGPAADVYALGAILYELVTGRPPFQGETALDVLSQVVRQEPVAPTRLVPRVPRDLETITLKCLQKPLARRYASAQDLADDLARFLAGEPIKARPVSSLERLGKWVRRRPAAAAALALGVVLVVVGALWYHSELQAENRRLREEVSEQQRLQDQRSQAQGLHRAAQEEFASARSQADARARYLGSAHEKLEKARTIIGAEPSLADLRSQVDRLLARTEAWQKDLEAEDRSRELGAQALFFSTQVNGPDGTASVKKVRELARAALVALGWTGRSVASILNRPHLSKQERAAIAVHCYGLLLILAEVQARPLPDEAPIRQAARALRLLKQAAGLSIRTRAYHLRRARYLEQHDDAADAARERLRAERIPPTSASAVDLFLLGEDRSQRQDLKGAIDYFGRALRHEPRHFGAQLLMGICYLQLQHPVEAVFCLRNCASARPRFIWVHLLDGFAHGMLGQLALDSPGLSKGQRRAQANAQFQEAEADFRKAEALPRGVDENYLLYVHRGVLRIYQRRFPDAVADLRRAARLKPDQYQAYLNLAKAYEHQGKPAQAIRELTTAIGLAKGQASLYRTRAQLFLQLKPPDRPAALRDLGLAIQNEHGSKSLDLADDHKQRGILRELKGDYAAAVQEFDAALRVRPGYAVVMLLRAEALMKLGRPRDQVQALDDYLKRLTSQVNGRSQKRSAVADVYRFRALARAKLHDYRGALDDYTRALEMDPNAATCAFRGWLYVANQAPELALSDFQEAIRRDPNNGDAYAGCGYARVRLNQPRRAVADADKALRLGPKEPRLLYNAARVYAQASAMVLIRLGQGSREARALSPRYQARALELLRQALDLCPTAPERKQFWQSYIKADPALRPLRRTSPYDRLARIYAAPTR